MKEDLKTDGPWTMFRDMHSGGSAKVKPYEKILIRGTEDQAVEIFSEIFERDPRHATCLCCGEDYAISEASDLYQVTGFSRNCAWNEEAKKYEEVQGCFRFRVESDGRMKSYLIIALFVVLMCFEGILAYMFWSGKLGIPVASVFVIMCLGAQFQLISDITKD